MNTYYTVFPAKLGHMLIAGNDEGLLRVSFAGRRGGVRPGRDWIEDRRRFSREVRAVQGYISGDGSLLQNLNWKTAARGTPFQREVWNKMREIPFGKTVTYGELAQSVGRPGAARAVGGACHANPLLLLVPCHRVIGSGCRLGGFGWGPKMKKFLLRLENADAEFRP